jgi:hypothetical protein
VVVVNGAGGACPHRAVGDQLGRGHE